MKLNLGCGNKKLAGWVNCDIDQSVAPDKIVDLNLKIPFKNNSVKEVLLDNVVEHLHIPLDKFFTDLNRILERNGTAKIIMPNFFRWKSRINFLFNARLEDADGWEINHSCLINYSDFRAMLRNKGFEVPKKSFIAQLFEPEINIVIRKRDDLTGVI